MNKKPPSRLADQFVVRLPDGMRELIATAADENSRSMNSEIVSRLAASFAGTIDESRLTTKAARLALSLAAAEFREHSANTKLHKFASAVHDSASALLEELGQHDERARTVLAGLVQKSEPHIKQLDLLEAEQLEKIAAVREASALLHQAGNILAAKVGLPAPFPPDASETLPHAADVHPDLVVGDNVELPGKRARRKKKTGVD